MTPHAHPEFGRRPHRQDDADWYDDGYDEPPRRGVLSRLFGLLKLAVFLTPLGIFLYGYALADCRSGGGTGLGQIVNLLGPISGGKVYGIIGQDVLKEHRAVIDVAKPILYLVREDNAPAPVAAEPGSGPGWPANA